MTMKIPGYITAPLLTGAVLGATLGLFTVLPIGPTAKSTSEENTFGKNESLDLMVRTKDGEELHLRVTGRNTTEALKSLKQILKSMEERSSVEKS